MIEVNHTQAGIIQAFLKSNKGRIESKEGLSSIDLKKLGVNRKSFDNHLGFLLNHRLIKIARREDKHGVQTWTYYKLTLVGVLSYLQYITSSEIRKNVKLMKYFPLIVRHWEKIDKWYGGYSAIILQRILKNFNIEKKVYVGERESKEEAPLHINLESILTLQLNEFEVSFKKEAGFDPYKESEQQNDLNQEFEELESEIVKDFTFTFFFYFLNLPFNFVESNSIWWKRHASLQEERLEIEGKPEIKGKLKIKGRQKDYLKSINRFNEKTKQNSIRVLSIIKKDEELKKLFVERLNFINERLRKPKILTILEEEMQ